MTVAACREPSRVTISPSRTTQGRRCTRKAKRATLARQASSRPLCVLEGASRTLGDTPPGPAGRCNVPALQLVAAALPTGQNVPAPQTSQSCLSRHHDAEPLRSSRPDTAAPPQRPRHSSTRPHSLGS